MHNTLYEFAIHDQPKQFEKANLFFGTVLYGTGHTIATIIVPEIVQWPLVNITAKGMVTLVASSTRRSCCLFQNTTHPNQLLTDDFVIVVQFKHDTAFNFKGITTYKLDLFE
jgi:hypothetical protein